MSVSKAAMSRFLGGRRGGPPVKGDKASPTVKPSKSPWPGLQKGKRTPRIHK